MYFILTKWWSNNLLLTIVFFAAFFYQKNADAQLVQTQRHEILLSENDNYKVAPAGTRGIFAYRKLESDLNTALEITFLDTTFHEKWHGFLKIEKNYIIANQAFFDSTLFFILRYHDLSKNDMRIIALQCANGSYTEYVLKNFIPFNPIEFHITKNAALIGGYFNKTPVVIYYNFITRKSNVVPGLFNEPGELNQLRTYADGSFDILVSAKNQLHKKTIWIRNYDSEGTLMENTLLESSGKKNLIFGRSIKTKDNMQIVAGVYSTNASDFSKGVFVASINPTGVQQLRYYNYGDLHNFFKYMRTKREARVKNRIERRHLKGKPIRFNYRLLVHELIPYNNQFILLGEAFYPHYKYNSSSTGGFFTPGIQSGQVFDGYYYTHAIVMGFDDNGKLLWDNSFEINDVKTLTLEQFVKIDAKEDKIALHYLFNNEIRSKIIKDNMVLEGKKSDPIKLKLDDDIMKKNDTELSKLEYWYRDYFVAYGIQRVTNIHNGNVTKRKVFFINKVSYK